MKLMQSASRIQGPYLTVQTTAPMKNADNPLIYSPWSEIAFDLPPGLWKVDWQLLGVGMEEDIAAQFDLAILQQPDPPFGTVKRSRAQYYASESEGASLVYGPARFWVRQSPLNFIACTELMREVGLHFVATEVSELDRATGLTTERVVALIDRLEGQVEADISPEIIAGVPWRSEVFRIIQGKYTQGANGDVVEINRYVYGDTSDRSSNATITLGSIVKAMPFSFMHTQPDLNPQSKGIWGTLKSLSTILKIENVVMVWEKA